MTSLPKLDMVDHLQITKAMLHVTAAGAGTTLLQSLWHTLGVSSVLSGASLPYHQTGLESCLGHTQEGSAVTEEVAYDLAIHAFLQAARATGNPVGVGLTAAVAKDRVPRGGLHAHIVVIAKAGVAHNEVMLERGMGQELRRAHDDTIAWAVSSLVAHVLSGGALNDADLDQRAIARILAYPGFTPAGRFPGRSALWSDQLFLPSALNPLHDGHQELMTLAEERTELKGCYLVEIDPPHKEAPTAAELLLKAAAVAATKRSVLFTKGEPLFIDKARKRPGSTFAIGADTMARMLQPNWGPDPVSMCGELLNLGTRFLVLPRRFHDGKIYGPKEILPNGDIAVRRMFEALDGHIDISSTELRKGA